MACKTSSKPMKKETKKGGKGK
jgi:hypothetical protein